VGACGPAGGRTPLYEHCCAGSGSPAPVYEHAFAGAGDRLHDECGVFGIYAPGMDVARHTYFGLYALQHRGQESAGIAVADADGQVTVVKELGLVSQVFNERTLASLTGNHAIGHVRYSTTGSTQWQNSQPLVRPRNGSVIALGHNGNLVNTTELRKELLAEGVRFSSATDTEVITALIAQHGHGDLMAAMRHTVARIRGAFSATLLTADAMAGFRDPYGVRPLCLGCMDEHPVIASESAAFDILGARFVREIEPGEIVLVDKDGLRSERVELEGARPAMCIFEFIYFARPDSVLNGRSLHECRQNMGRHLHREAPVEADLVIPVPDTGIPAAIGYSLESGIPFAEGLIKNRYVYRTFIQPDQALREVGIRMKLNPLSSVIKGKRLVVVDDSIVRGTTTGKIVDMLYGAGATEVHLRICAPPIMYPCFYGIDMATRAELIAANKSVEEIRAHVGATTLHYLSLDGLQESTGLPANQFCRACFTGDYPIQVPEELAMCKMRFEGSAADCVP
jgi:amidophosphoribosyltransferase